MYNAGIIEMTNETQLHFIVCLKDMFETNNLVSMAVNIYIMIYDILHICEFFKVIFTG